MKNRIVISFILVGLLLSIFAGCASRYSGTLSQPTTEQGEAAETSGTPAISGTVPLTTARKPLTAEQWADISRSFGFFSESSMEYISSLTPKEIADYEEWMSPSGVVDLTPITTLTPEQKAKISELYNQGGRRYPYQIMQIVNPTDPLLRRELTLEGVKEIIAEWAEQEELPYPASYYIELAIADKQPYEDVQGGSGNLWKAYWLDGLGNEVITVRNGGSITYIRQNNGEVVENVELY